MKKGDQICVNGHTVKVLRVNESYILVINEYGLVGRIEAAFALAHMASGSQQNPAPVR